MAEGFFSQKKIPITPSQSVVLYFVAKRKKSNVKEIAEKLNVTSSAATQLIDGLVKNGFLEKTEGQDDRRIVNVAITEKTKKQIARMQERILERIQEILSPLSEEEFKTYLKITQKIAENLNRNDS